MGYQALPSASTKNWHASLPGLRELDFKVEPVNEPFAAVKKLIGATLRRHRCRLRNEPNATLLFKKARNSSSNQSSLALALVEGQSGVAKAYRIGANLVLTKPINVEQAKGTFTRRAAALCAKILMLRLQVHCPREGDTRAKVGPFKNRRPRHWDNSVREHLRALGVESALPTSPRLRRHMTLQSLLRLLREERKSWPRATPQ